MTHSSNTTHYQLPKFAPSDHPDWVEDITPAMDIIDTEMWNISERTPDTSYILAILSGLGLNTVEDAKNLLAKIEGKMDKYPTADQFGIPPINEESDEESEGQ